MREVVPGVFRSALPKARDVAAFADAGGRTLVDLTQRERETVARACERYGVRYIKHPVAYDGRGADEAVSAVLSADRPVLFHCFHGRYRTGIVARRVAMRDAGRVVLHRVGRNINRAYRTCEAFGIPVLALHDCDARLSGRVYGASGRVTVESLNDLPVGDFVLALETDAGVPLGAVDWSGVRTLVIGGETSGLPRGMPVQYAHITMCGMVSGLTVEAALAIALHSWRGAC